jgi:hypothetical protein
MAKTPKEPESDKDADAKRDAVLKRMLETPPQHKTTEKKPKTSR